jgi:phosphoribosylglycinamide formyltransferase-1
MKVISFLASHGGSAARAIINAAESGALKANIGVVITNNRDSAIYAWCVENNVTVHYVSGNTHADEALKDQAIKDLLQQAGSDLIVLSGYMKKIGPVTLAAFDGQMLNIHPSLLPKHGGAGLYGDNVHRSVLASDDTESGATVHFINEAYDEGPVIVQHRVPVLPSDDVASLKTRVQAIEGELYLKAVQKLA